MTTRPGDDLAGAVRAAIRDVPDFPQPGILFRDLAPVMRDAALFGRVGRALAAPFAAARITRVLAIESRGFIFGAPVAERLTAGVVPVRKVGRLPGATVTVEYALEYGSATLEIQRDAVSVGDRVLIVDDVLATGGTAAAAAELAARCGAEIAGFAFVVALAALGGRERLRAAPIEVLVDL